MKSCSDRNTKLNYKWVLLKKVCYVTYNFFKIKREQKRVTKGAFTSALNNIIWVFLNIPIILFFISL